MNDLVYDLTSRRCATGAQAARLADAELDHLLAGLPGWSREGNEIRKTYTFGNYHETMAFVNATAWISHREDHHPDMGVHYNRCVVSYSTHDAGGITMNDLICAAKLDALFSA